MKKYQLTEDMAQDRKYWMTKILAGPAQGDGQERWEMSDKAILAYMKQKYLAQNRALKNFQFCCQKV